MRRLVILLLLTTATAYAQPFLDDFESISGWRPVTSDGVELRIGQDEGRRGRAMRLDFDFHGGAGYAITRKDAAIELPENYEFSLWMRADAPVNNLEFKLVDPSGENVWWVNRRDFDYPRAWRKITLKKRHFSFAWGPVRDEPSKLGAIEIVVAAGTGGKGTVWIDELTLAAVPPRLTNPPPPRLSSSSARDGRAAARAHDGSRDTIWHSNQDGRQWIALDLIERRDFGGLTIDWGATQFARDYEVQVRDLSDDWETVYRVTDGNGGRDFIYLPESEARALRLLFTKSSQGNGYAIREIMVRPVEWSDSLNNFWTAVAGESRRGDYPRYLYKEQSYWTVLGVDGDTRESLLSEDAMLETGKASLSIEPFLYADGRLITWADVTTSHSLADGYLPVPTTTWTAKPFRLEVTAHAEGAVERSTVYARYRMASESPSSASVKLFLAVRPFQVNPPWQFLNTIGGFAPIRDIAFDGRAVTVNEHRRIVPLSLPFGFGAATLDHGNIVEFLRRGEVPSSTRAEDSNGFASAVMAWNLSVAKDKPAVVVVAIALHEDSPVQSPNLEATLDQWREKSNRVSIDLPGSGKRLADTVRSNIAYILINRDRGAIQPGSRSYERSWIRDGSLTSAALLRLGHFEAVREFIEWYAPYQFPNGKVPCCADRRGADPVPEHDSHGQLIYLIAEYYRYTRDRDFLRTMWPHVERAVAYIDTLRRERMTPEYQTAEKRAFYGLVPESISHEGYSDKPMHSYWDDLFILKGLKDAAWIAGQLDEGEAEQRFAAIRDEFRKNLQDSLRLAMAAKRIDYIPGSVELGDFDATSTTVAVTPAEATGDLPRRALERTFEKYWLNHLDRVAGNNWQAYTPYELRTVGTFVRLGQKDRALRLLDFFFQHQRPPGWNHWAEVVFRNKREPRFIGDMPHTWVGSDFVRSFLDMLLYEEEDGTVVVGAGVDPPWVRDGLEVRNLRTTYGTVSFNMSGDTREARVTISGNPPKGLLNVHSPFGVFRSVSIGETSADRRVVSIAQPSLPLTITFQY